MIISGIYIYIYIPATPEVCIILVPTGNFDLSNLGMNFILGSFFMFLDVCDDIHQDAQ